MLIDKRDDNMTAVAYETQNGLYIVGATAIEERLQDRISV